MSLYKLRSTWDSHLPLKRLYDLDVAVQGIDSNWPVKPLPASLQEKASTSIHVNPKFLKVVLWSLVMSFPGCHEMNLRSYGNVIFQTDSLPVSSATSRITSSKTTVSGEGSMFKFEKYNIFLCTELFHKPEMSKFCWHCIVSCLVWPNFL